MRAITRQEGIRQALIARICAGEWAVGGKLPGVRELAVEFAASPATVDQVLRALVDLGYLSREERRGTFVAPAEYWGRRAAPSGRLIGVIAGFAAYILPHIDQELRAQGYGMVVRHVHDDISIALASITELQRYGVRGFIWSPLVTPHHERDNARLAEALLQTGIPAVAVDQYPADVEVHCVTSDNAQSGYRLTRHLLDMGHRRIGLVRWQHGSTADDRHRGYARALREAGITTDPSPVCALENPIAPQEAVLTLRTWLQETRPTAAWAISSNPLGSALLAATQAEGLSIPGDLSMATVDQIVAPIAITTIIQPFAEMGRRAVRLLCDEIARPSGEVQRIVLRSTLELGASCAPPLLSPSADVAVPPVSVA